VSALAGLLTYIASVCIYRLYFHPLAKFPAPPLAAINTWYEGYYDIVKKGRYIFEVGKMHNKHGLSFLPSWPQEGWSTAAAK
jgi:hypothetical protein